MLEALLQAVRETPDEDAPRLILADWLEEHGDEAERERAEFIRLQCRLDRLPDHDLGYRALRNREELLLAGHRAAWQGSADGDWIRGLFMLVAQEESLDELLTNPRIWPWTQAVSIRAAVWEPWIERLLRSEALRWVGAVSLDVPCRDREVAFLAASPQLGNLTALRIGKAYFSPEGWRTLLSSPHLPRLESLSLAAWGGEQHWLAGLPHTPLPAALRRLRLSYAALGDAGAAVVASAAPLARLQQLDLEHSGLSPAGARALAAAPLLPRPIDLMLRANPIGDDGVLALLDGGFLLHGSRLDLFKIDLGLRGAAALAACPRSANVRELLLPFNAIPAEGAVALARSPYLAGLTVLDLTYNQVGDDGARALARSSCLRSLVRLELTHNRIGPEGALALACGDLPGLVTLELAGNSLGAQGVRDFLAALALPALRQLEFSGTGLGDEGAAVVAGSPALARLRVLYLKDNRITSEGARALAASPYLAGLEHLEIWGNAIDRAGADALRHRLGARVIVGDEPR